VEGSQSSGDGGGGGELAELRTVVARLTRSLETERLINDGLRQTIARLRQPSSSGVNWSRERDHTGEA